MLRKSASERKTPKRFWICSTSLSCRSWTSSGKKVSCRIFLLFTSARNRVSKVPKAVDGVRAEKRSLSAADRSRPEKLTWPNAAGRDQRDAKEE